MKGWNKITTDKIKGLTAGEISKLAGIELLSRDLYTWRQNNVRAVRGRTFTGEKGQSDRIGYSLETGRFVACEVKKIGDTISEKQKEFLDKVLKSGGHPFIATQNEETGKFELQYWTK